RFRNRLMWPIKDMTDNTIGYGARQLDENDKGPKYLNTPETMLYKKSQVLYGLNMAKKHIARQRQLVVVEGYTDVMAAHLAGIETAVATCGTAFGEGHVRIARRLITDDGSGGEIIFTFDGDEAGQKQPCGPSSSITRLWPKPLLRLLRQARIRMIYVSITGMKLFISSSIPASRFLSLLLKPVSRTTTLIQSKDVLELCITPRPSSKKFATQSCVMVMSVN